MTYKNALLTTCAVLTTIGATSAHAQSTTPAAPPLELVVTANRAPVRIDQVGQSLTVLNAQAIQASQATTITELLAQTPGVTFARNGGQGKSTSIFIRGAETGQTVVLIDGVRLNDPSSTDTGASLSDIVSGDISRIEVLRGAQSTLYGSQAIGGVINIITQAPVRPLELNGTAEGGGLSTADAKVSAGGKTDKLTWRLGGGYFTTAGVSAIATGKEKDGYVNYTVDGRVGYAVTDHVSLDLRSFWTYGKNQFDDFNADAPVYGINRELLSYAGLNFDLFGDRLKNRVSYEYSDLGHLNYDQRPARVTQPVTFDAQGLVSRYEYQGTFKISDMWSGVFGVEDENARMRTASPSVAAPHPTPIQAKDNTQGYYAQAQVEPLKGLTLTGGARYEHQNVFGGHTVGSASGAYSINEGQTVLRASWAEGFKAPSLYQLYSQYGNLSLTPEQASSWDIGFEHHLLPNVSVSTTYFSRDTTDLIIFVSCTAATAGNPLCKAPRTAFYDHVGKVHAEGEEVGASVSLGRFSASANYTHLNATNRTPGDVNKGKKLARRPDDTANLTVSYNWPVKLVTAMSVRYSGDNFNDAGNTQLLRHYTLVDFRVSYPINEHFEVYARLENAFNQSYQTTLGYGTYPATGYAGLRARF